MRLIAISLPPLRTFSCTVSPGAYSPSRVLMEPVVPTLLPLTSVITSRSFNPALSAALFLRMADLLASL